MGLIIEGTNILTIDHPNVSFGCFCWGSWNVGIWRLMVFGGSQMLQEPFFFEVCRKFFDA